jgi:hypothetical protein
VRKLIAGMKISVDGKMEGADGTADWVDAWSEDYGLTPQIDACLLGAGMYPGYEGYWTSIQNEPQTPAWITGKPPTPAELDWARFIKQTLHYVLSITLTQALWPTTRFVRGLDEITAQAATRQGHLSRRRRSNDGEPHRCRAGGRTSADCSSADRRRGQGALRDDPTSSRA